MSKGVPGECVCLRVLERCVRVCKGVLGRVRACKHLLMVEPRLLLCPHHLACTELPLLAHRSLRL